MKRFEGFFLERACIYVSLSELGTDSAPAVRGQLQNDVRRILCHKSSA